MGSDMPERNAGTVVRAGARGLVAAMAMTGVRTVTAAVGPHEETPPEAFVKEHLPFLRKLSPRHQEALTELFHWTYGAAGGVVYGMLPHRFRGNPLSGPVYGLAIWIGFEAGIAPALGVRHVHEHGFEWRAAVALDHVLYGIVVGGRLAPEPAGSGGRVTRRRFPRPRPGRGPR